MFSRTVICRTLRFLILLCCSVVGTGCGTMSISGKTHHVDVPAAFNTVNCRVMIVTTDGTNDLYLPLATGP